MVLSNLPARIGPHSFAGYQLQILLQIFPITMDTVLFFPRMETESSNHDEPFDARRAPEEHLAKL